MAHRYALIPDRAQAAGSDELDDAFGSDDEDTTTNTQPVVHVPHIHVPGAYDFEREYQYTVPPGSPPRSAFPSALALPNDFGNSNGRLPTEPVVPPVTTPSFFRRAVGAILPTHYTRLPGSDPSTSASFASVRGGGIENDGVFANVMAKPQRAQTVRTEDGQVHMVPEDNQKEAPPSYAAAQADSVPPYWDTTVHAPGMNLGSDMIIDDLPSGSIWVFFVNMFISFFFQFVGFLLTFLLHTSHAAKYGSRAGLGLTLVQYGFYSRSGGVNEGGADEPPEWPALTPNSVPDQADASSSPEVPRPDADISVGGVSSRDWLSFLLMTIGWFLLLSSFIGFWRIKRWESSIRASSTPITAEDVQRDAAIRRNIENVFGFSFGEEQRNDPRQPTLPVHTDENGSIVIIPTQELLEEARLARDLRAAGLL
ncbi:metal homeostatis protein BSD2 [Favolaschia claudopus]|uniref:Metal homeostatis protein BSD2 n=1 Tax=Favolaschia claudopus TaxID=2862362 RepID=A0AAW0C355_9AGAR